jgi:hypothetical protein
MRGLSILISVIISFARLSLRRLSRLSTVPQMIWQRTFSPNPYPSGRSHRICVPSGYVAFEGEWWNLSRRGSVRKHPSMQHLALGLCLEQTPKPIFGPCYGASRPLLYARPIPFVISLPLSYSSAMSHSPILTIHLTQACPTQMDTRPHYPYHAPLTIIANATHFGTLLLGLLLPVRDM